MAAGSAEDRAAALDRLKALAQQLCDEIGRASTSRRHSRAEPGGDAAPPPADPPPPAAAEPPPDDAAPAEGGPPPAEDAAAAAAGPPSPAAAPQAAPPELELILASDPVHAEPVSPLALPPLPPPGPCWGTSSSSSRAGPPPESPGPHEGGGGLAARAAHLGGAGGRGSLCVTVGAVHLRRRLPPEAAACHRIVLRYAAPATSPSGLSCAEDVVSASCRNVSEDGALLLFHHTSIHPLHLTAHNLAELTAQPLQLELLLAEDRAPAAAAPPHGLPPARPAEQIGSAQVSWHEALLAEDRVHHAEVELWPPGPSHRWKDPVGKVSVTVSLPGSAADHLLSSPARVATPGRTPMDFPGLLSEHLEPKAVPSCQACPLHLRVTLGRVVLRATPMLGVTAVLKVGPAQELIAAAVPAGPREGAFSSAAVSAEPIWKVDVATGHCVDGPRPPRLFLQLWRRRELIGMLWIALPVPDPGLAKNLAAGDRAAALRRADCEVLAAESGVPMGSVYVTLEAGTPLALAHAYHPFEAAAPDRQATPRGEPKAAAPPPPAPPPAEAVKPGSPEGQHPVRAILELLLPISERTVSAGFGERLATGLAEAAAVSQDRVQVLKLQPGSPAVELQINPGPATERTPLGAAAELAAQLTEPRSPLRTGRLAPHLVHAFLRCDPLVKPPAPAPSAPPPAAAPSPEQKAAALFAQAAAAFASPRGPLAAGSEAPGGTDARSLLGALALRVRRGLRPSAAAAVLAGAAERASERRPDLWCAQEVHADILARIDPQGAAAAVAAWEVLLGPQPPPEEAVAALLALARPSRSGDLTVGEAAIRGLLGEQDPDRVSRGVKARLFEVVLASGTTPLGAFAALDSNGDGIVSIAETAATLQELGLPLSSAEAALITSPAAQAEGLTVAQFVDQYREWLRGGKVVEEKPPGEALGKEWTQAAREAFLAAARPPPPPAPPAPPPEEKPTTPCLSLPIYMTFACLDALGQGTVPTASVRAFAATCLGFKPDTAAQAAATCDPTGRGTVTYKDFRRYMEYLEWQHAAHRSEEELASLSGLRAAVRLVLELVSQPAGSAERAGAETAVGEALKKRNRYLDLAADVPGLEELLGDLHMPSAAAAPVLQWQKVIGKAALAERFAPPTFRAFLDLLRRAKAILNGHVNVLYGAVLKAPADLQVILEPVMRREDQTLPMQELQQMLQAAGVDLAAVDMAEVLMAVDPNSTGRAFAPILVRGFCAFRARCDALMQLANTLGPGGLSTADVLAMAGNAA